jgi:urease accessory protein
MIAVADRRLSGQVGHHARLELVFAVRGGRTVLAHAYAEPPYRVVPGFDHPLGLHLIVASSAPGIFGGDALEQSVIVEPGARVLLTSQSATQLHPHRCGQPARVRGRYVVRDGATLRCDWDPLIPFADAALDHHVTIDLEGSARLMWMDATMAGRVGRGERWRMSSLAHELRLAQDGRLEYLERYTIRPASCEDPPEGGRHCVTAPWIAGDADYFGTAIVKGVSAAPEFAERLHFELAGVEGIQAAADALSDRLVVVRMMSVSGAAFHRARDVVRSVRLEPDLQALECPLKVRLKPDATSVGESSG